MSDVPPLPEKKDVSRSFLLRGTVFLHLDPRHKGVVVPAWLRNQPQLVLQIGLDMPIPIADLRVDDVGVTGSLSFNRNLCLCVVPWGAVFAIVGEDGRGVVWPESMPAEIAAEVEHEANRSRLRDASRPEPAVSHKRDELRDRVTSPAPAVGSVPELRLAPTPAHSSEAPSPESAVRLPRSATAATTAAQPVAQRRATTKHLRGGVERGGKRPLPPYLRVVK